MYIKLKTKRTTILADLLKVKEDYNSKNEKEVPEIEEDEIEF